MRRNWRVQHGQPLRNFFSIDLIIPKRLQQLPPPPVLQNYDSRSQKFRFIRVLNPIRVSEQSSNNCSMYQQALLVLRSNLPLTSTSSTLAQYLVHLLATVLAVNSKMVGGTRINAVPQSYAT